MASSRMTPKPASIGERTDAIMHRAARIEDTFHRWRERRGRKRGLRTTIIPYTGYGAPGWARVLCRVVLTRGDVAAKQRAAKVRGWRSFFSIPVNDVEVTISAGGVEHRVTADRGGVIDFRFEVTLKPGWRKIKLSTDDTEPVTARVFIVRPTATFGIVSDVDDTVMVTASPGLFLPPGTPSCSTSTLALPYRGWQCSTNGSREPTPAHP